MAGAGWCDSSGESTADSPSTPLASAGSGALRQALNIVSILVNKGRVRTSAHLDEVFAFGLGDERLKLRCGEGVDETSLGDDE